MNQHEEQAAPCIGRPGRGQMHLNYEEVSSRLAHWALLEPSKVWSDGALSIQEKGGLHDSGKF